MENTKLKPMWTQGKFLIPVSVAAILFLSLLWYSSKKDSGPHVPLESLGSIDPNVQLNTPNPQNFSYTVLHFWASWCGPCKSEMPTLFEAKSKLPNTLNLILLSEDDNPQEALKFMQQMAPKIPNQFLYWDSKKAVSDTMNVHMFPETYIFDSHMHLIRRIAGGMNWNDPANLSYLQSLK